MIQAIPDFALPLAEMESSLQALKKLVSLGWTYAVIWKIGPDHRTPVWHQSYFNELAEAEVGQAQRFENIYRRCQFTPVRPGYAYLAWQRQSPLWWTRPMEPVLTDENKELFLRQAGIQTLVCFPGRAPADGSGYCVELASTYRVSETEYFRTSIQDLISTSVAPHISLTSPLLEEVPALVMEDVPTSSISPVAAMAAVAHQDFAILTDITSQASIGEDEAIEGFSNIVRPEEPYYPWTMSGSLYVSAGLSNYPVNFGDMSIYNPDFDLSFNYGGSSPILEPFHELEGVSAGQTLAPCTEWTTSGSSGSRKGKEILVEESDLGLTGKQSLINLPTLQSLSLLQQEALEKLRSPPALAPSLPSARDSEIIMRSGSSRFRSSAANLRPIGQVPPGHSPRSLFQPHRHAQFPRFGATKRQSLIHKWAMTLAPQIARMRVGLQGPGGEGLGGRGSFDDNPGTHIFDPRSPNSLAHDHLAAETHKIAERKRRSKMNNKLRTLISIVPIIDKKDKVSVLTSTIEYIRQLTSRISNFENVAEAAPSTSRMEEGATECMDRDEELALFSNVEGGGPSSSSSSGGPVVVVERSPDGETWLIKVEANNHSRSLIQLLNVLQGLDLGVINVDYGTMNGRFRANVCVKNSRNLSTSSSELQATLCGVLETVDSSPTGSD